MVHQNFEIDFKRLYELAKAKREERSLETDLYVLKKFLDYNYDAKLFLDDLSYDKEHRKKFLKEIFPASSRIFWDLIELVIVKNRTELLSSISEQYTRFLAKTENIEFAELILSQEIPMEAINKIKVKFGENISFKVMINPSILGGFIIRKIDGTIIDGSLLGRLNQLKRGMLKNGT